MGQAKACQHCMVTLKEIGIVLQISRNRFFFRFYGGDAASFPCCHICQTST